MKRKYGNRKTVVDNIKFDSGLEAARYQQLKLLERAGQITDLELQPRFELIPKQCRADGKPERAVVYIADFMYRENGALVVEDVKSEVTRKRPEYVVKRKLLLKEHGITLKEVM